MVEIGIIGGSGLYNIEGLSDIKEIELDTPFGQPVAPYLIGTLHGKRVAFLPRHGKHHQFPPSAVNYRANIWGFKKLGAKAILSVSAVGSMKEEYVPGSVVLVDQFIDWTKKRDYTFFDKGITVHIQFSEPICKDLFDTMALVLKDKGTKHFLGGTYVCIEGPSFSTKAESHLFRSFGVDVIGMTNVPEVKLAREAQICYLTLCMVTDYDCWHESEEDVSVDAVLKVLKKNEELSKELISEFILRYDTQKDCQCHHALDSAVLTDISTLNSELQERYRLLLGL